MALRTAFALVLAATVVAGSPRNPVRPAAPTSGHASDSGKLPADILCSVYGGDHCKSAPGAGGAVSPPAAPASASLSGPRRVTRQLDQGDQNGAIPDLGIDPDQVCSIFGGPSCPADKNKVYESCTCPPGLSGGCECVPYYNCDGTTGEFNQDGKGIIDIRQKSDADKSNSSCEHYLQQCCKIRDGPGPNPAPNPDPVPDPDPNPFPTNPDPTPDPFPGPNPGPNPGPGPVPFTKQECGVRNRGGIGSRISGAFHDETQFGEIPWMVAIFKRKQSEREYLCGGGLIAPNVVLTAAHCIDDKTPSSLTVRAGEWDSRTEDEAYKHQDCDVAELITHPDYKDQSLHNDLGLLILVEPVKVGYHIGTICLPEQGQNFNFKNCLVSGWGKDVFGKDGVYQNILRRIDDLPVVPHDQCQDKLRKTRLGNYFRLNRSFMCAGGVKGKDACTGDGGSPLVCPITEAEDSRYVFSGIVSWGVGCGEEDVPGVYANVALFRTWIEQLLTDRKIELCS